MIETLTRETEAQPVWYRDFHNKREGRVHWVRFILPQVLTWMTGKERYLPDEPGWRRDMLLSNVFRAWERIAWRRKGVRVESSARAYFDGKEIIAHQSFDTLEALTAHVEAVVRSYFTRALWSDVGRRITTQRFAPVPVYMTIAVLGIKLGIHTDMHGALLPLMGMSIAYDTSTNTPGTSAATSGSMSMTLGASASLLAIMPCTTWSSGSGQATNAASYNSVAATLAIEDYLNATTPYGTGIWYLLAPATGASHSVQASWSNSSKFNLIAISLSGTDTSSPIGTTGYAAVSSTDVSKTITTAQDNSVILTHCFLNQRYTVSATGTGHTMRENVPNSGDNFTTAGGTMTTTTAGSYTPGYHYSSSTNLKIVVAEVKEPSSTTYNQTIAGTFSATGSVTKRLSKTLSGTIGVQGTMTKQLSITLAGAMAFAGAVKKQLAVTLAGNMGMAGDMTAMKVFLVSLASSFGLGGAIVKTPGKIMAGTMGMQGTLTKQIPKTLSGTMGIEGSITKQLAKTLGATFGLTGGLIAGSLHSVTMAATMGMQGALKKSVGVTIAGTMGFTGALSTARAVIMAGTMGFVGDLSKVRGVLMAGTIGFVGRIRQDFFKQKYPPKANGPENYEVKYPHGD